MVLIDHSFAPLDSDKVAFWALVKLVGIFDRHFFVKALKPSSRNRPPYAHRFIYERSQAVNPIKQNTKLALRLGSAIFLRDDK